MPPKPIKLDRELILSVAKEVAETERIPSRARIASRLGMVESTLNKALRREGLLEAVDAIIRPGLKPQIEEPGVHRNEDGSSSVVSDPANQPPAPWKPDELLKAHGLDADEWEIVRVRTNRWGDVGEPNHQLRVDVVPRRELIAIPDPSEWKPPPKAKRAKKGKTRSIVVCGDHHAPHHDATLHRLFCEWLADELPDEGVLLGDLMDFSTISRHREREGFAQSVNEGLTAAFQILMDYRHASPGTKWTMLRGNHDDRLYLQILDNIRGLHNITAAGDDVPALSFRRLLHLDDLDIDLVEEDWDRGKTKLTRRFTARHGYTSAKNSTEQMLSRLAHSTIQGHTHRLSIRYRTEHDDDDKDQPTSTRMAAEAGCMAQIREGLGYTNDPDWQQGAMLVYAYPDGDFHVAPLIYVPGRLLAPGGRRYESPTRT